MVAGGASLKDLGRGSRGVRRTWASWSAQGVAVVTRRVREWLLGWGQLSLGMSSPRVLGPGSKSRLQAQLAPPQPPCMAPCAARTSEQLAGLARGTAPLRSGSGAKRPASSDWDVSSVGPWGEQRSVSAGWPRHSGRVCTQWALGDTERPLVTHCCPVTPCTHTVHTGVHRLYLQKLIDRQEPSTPRHLNRGFKT